MKKKRNAEACAAPDRCRCEIDHGGVLSVGRNVRNVTSHNALLSRYFHTIANIPP